MVFDVFFCCFFFAAWVILLIRDRRLWTPMGNKEKSQQSTMINLVLMFISSNCRLKANKTMSNINIYQHVCRKEVHLSMLDTLLLGLDYLAPKLEGIFTHSEAINEYWPTKWPTDPHFIVAVFVCCLLLLVSSLSLFWFVYIHVKIHFRMFIYFFAIRYVYCSFVCMIDTNDICV